MAVMEQKVNFFTILPNHKLGQFTLKELTKHLGIFHLVALVDYESFQPDMQK